ncbi:MAG TPA: hypothetical protein V6C52_01335 [Coleofasciculaceae cyanobacterium]
MPNIVGVSLHGTAQMVPRTPVSSALAANATSTLGTGAQRAGETLLQANFLDDLIQVARPFWNSIKGHLTDPAARHQIVEFAREALTQVLVLEKDAGWRAIAMSLLKLLLTRRR